MLQLQQTICSLERKCYGISSFLGGFSLLQPLKLCKHVVFAFMSV